MDWVYIQVKLGQPSVIELETVHQLRDVLFIQDTNIPATSGFTTGDMTKTPRLLCCRCNVI